MTDNAFFGYILYSAVTLRLINQKELTCRPPVYTELTVSMTFLNYDLLNESVCTDARVHAKYALFQVQKQHGIMTTWVSMTPFPVTCHTYLTSLDYHLKNPTTFRKESPHLEEEGR